MASGSVSMLFQHLSPRSFAAWQKELNMGLLATRGGPWPLGNCLSLSCTVFLMKFHWNSALHTDHLSCQESLVKVFWAAVVHSLQTCFNFSLVNQICKMGSVVSCEKEWALCIDYITWLVQLSSVSFFNVIDIGKTFQLSLPCPVYPS